MSDPQREQTRRLSVEISPNGLQAWLKTQPGGTPPASAEVLAELATAKIVVDDKVQARVQEFLKLCSAGKGLPDRFLIAEGRPPVEACDGTVVWDAALTGTKDRQPDDASVDYFAVSNIVTVVPGTIIGRITPAIAAQDGVDVRGATLPPQRPGRRPTEISLGAGVEFSPENRSVAVSKVAGKVTLQNGTLSVVEVLDVKGDVDFKTGSINSSVDVHITGTIRDNFHVKSEKSVVVGGCIEQATVEAQGDIIVRNGVLGHGKGLVKAGGQLVAKFCEEANLVSAGDMSIAREAMNCSLHVDGKLLLPRGALIGGSAYAKEGAEVAVMGKPSGLATEISVGIHPQVLARIRAMDEETQAARKAVAEVQARLQPMIANLKRLAPKQKELVTEFLAKVEELKRKITENETSRAETLTQATPSGTPSVLISRTAHEGTRIRIGQYETSFEKDLKGPVRVEVRKVNEATQLVAVNQLTGSVTPLPTGYIQTESPAKVKGPHGA